MSPSLTIQVDYDEDARVWVAQSDQIPLVTEAETFEILFRKLPDMIQDVLADNADPRAGTDVRFELITHSHARPRSRVA
ncbi:hypothetical protein HNR60_001816 [Rhodopseudomonas rhenobacensis]|uniref:DUF1902 domain-containing protein n=1 Tax=Rhodopseudomonas rhenobacensis TaxID=87461 RepID=A0A7W7Z332_9BRAD|nr:DUF1902 domain-containing protein [Rhodopseudomonas rhenobacensis]MBB5047064.1 hypothetical protein [Rhodopseudomonas rhenobacensis]